MIYAFSSHRTDESLADGIRPWCFEWCFDFFDTAAFGNSRKQLAMLLVIVASEISGAFASGCGFSKLLSHPGVSWMAGDSRALDFLILGGFARSLGAVAWGVVRFPRDATAIQKDKSCNSGSSDRRQSDPGIHRRRGSFVQPDLGGRPRSFGGAAMTDRSNEFTASEV